MKQQTLTQLHQTTLPNGLEGAELAGDFKLPFFWFFFLKGQKKEETGMESQTNPQDIGKVTST